MGRIKDSNYYQVSGWMINRLGLAGRELQAYAIIYGFTQDGETQFNGSINYIAEWLNCTRKTVIETLKSLVEKGYITKTQTIVNGVKVNYYQTVLPIPASIENTLGSVENTPPQYKNYTTGSVENTPPPSVKITPNNNKDNNTNNYMDIREEKKALVPYEKIRNLYNETCKSLPKCLKLSENRKKHIAARWNEYGGDLETFVTLFTKAEASSFLTGNNDRSWNASFDWLMKPDNMTKVLESRYDNKGGGNNATKRNNQGSEKPRLSTAEYAKKLAAEGQLPSVPDFNELFATH